MSHHITSSFHAVPNEGSITLHNMSVNPLLILKFLVVTDGVKKGIQISFNDDGVINHQSSRSNVKVVITRIKEDRVKFPATNGNEIFDVSRWNIRRYI